MKLCIVDPASHIPSLKQLFPEAEYYAHEPDEFFTFITTPHYTKKQILDNYGFEYRIDWETIKSDTYDYLFISVPLLDYFKTISPDILSYVTNMKEKINTIIENNNFKAVVLFDTYDYDYDPNNINTVWKVDYYFKRNYSKLCIYKNNVFPFPYIMFVKPCLLGMVLNHTTNNVENKINKALWVGSLYNHRDEINNVYRSRHDIYDQISTFVDTFTVSEKEYNEMIRTYKIVVDLIGVGNPNKRTIEILCNDSLMLSMCCELEWGFDNGDDFHPDTFFKTADEFKIKLDKLLNNEDHYNTCLNQQKKIVEKYFNKKWLRSYIERCIQYPVVDTVSLFITACNRPHLLKQTLESFIKHNTYPIEYAVIVEDSGLQGINDFVYQLLPFPVKIIYAEKRRGQMKSIENGLKYLNTKYVFHCEEDWEFYDSGFIEESLEILKKDDKITSVWLREYEEIKWRYNFCIEPYNGYNRIIQTSEWGNFSWNPGLRTIEVQTKFTPYSESNLSENRLNFAFREIGMYSAIISRKEGCVRHIGWNDHVWNGNEW